MKRGQLCKSLAYLLVSFIIFALVSTSWAAGVVVEVPYAATDTSWWTGVAIKNLDENSATSQIKMEFFDTKGVLMGAAVEIAALDIREIYSQTTSNIYPNLLPTSYSIRISHSGSQELAVTVFVGNSSTGGFAYQTYNSRAVCSNTPAILPSWDQKLPDAERFVLVLDDAAVLDRETGLVWQRNTIDTMMNWYDAQAACYDLKIGGRMGWRLPTMDELATLVSTTQLDPALPAGDPFTNVKLSPYWSSTTRTGNTDYAWLVSFRDGSISSNTKPDKYYYVRAVRSRQ